MLQGCKVYIDDALCGTIDAAVPLGDSITVTCPGDGLFGKSIRIERTAGLTLLFANV
jgi:hypothetical protein